MNANLLDTIPRVLTPQPQSQYSDAWVDLVFIDPVGTGYSRMLDGEKIKEYHNYQRDLDSVGAFIQLYTTRHERWASPAVPRREDDGGDQDEASLHRPTVHRRCGPGWYV